LHVQFIYEVEMHSDTYYSLGNDCLYLIASAIIALMGWSCS